MGLCFGQHGDVAQPGVVGLNDSKGELIFTATSAFIWREVITPATGSYAMV